MPGRETVPTIWQAAILKPEDDIFFRGASKEHPLRGTTCGHG